MSYDGLSVVTRPTICRLCDRAILGAIPLIRPVALGNVRFHRTMFEIEPHSAELLSRLLRNLLNCMPHINWHGTCFVLAMDIDRPDLARRKRRRYWAIVALSVVLVSSALVGVARIGPAVATVELNNVWIGTVQRGPMIREVRGEGTLAPREIRWIVAATGASVAHILVRPGAEVQPNTVIMQLASPELQADLDTARAAVAVARAESAARRMSQESQLLDLRANVAQRQSAEKMAVAKLEAGEKLQKTGSIATLDFQEYQLGAEQQRTLLSLAQERVGMLKETIGAQLAADRARLMQLEDTYSLRHHQAESLTVRAVTTGVLQTIAVQEGAQVAAGTNLARIVQPGTLRAELRVPQTEAKDVLLGQRVAVDTRNGVIAGRVERIDPAVVHDSVQVDVELTGAVPAGARPDLSIEGTIEIERLADVLYLPRSATAQSGAHAQLFRLAADGRTASRVPVQWGRASVTNIEVSRGLFVGDRVVLSDTSVWDGHDRIRLK
jgi:HlyD family secretion protein